MEGCPETWYCVPEFNTYRKRLEHKIWDSTHLMTNMRRVICTNGTKELRRQAWIAAAKHSTTKLKQNMVLDLPDKQDIAFALTTFGFTLNTDMRDNVSPIIRLVSQSGTFAFSLNTVRISLFFVMKEHMNTYK